MKNAAIPRIAKAVLRIFNCFGSIFYSLYFQHQKPYEPQHASYLPL